MDNYHTISINRKGIVAHHHENRAWSAINNMPWNHNTPEHTVNWSFQWNPDEGDYPGAEALPNPRVHYEPPPANVIRKADKYFARLKKAHEVDLESLWWFMPLEEIQHITYFDVPLYLAQHSTIPHLLWYIAEHTGIAKVIYYVLENPHTSPGTIEALKESKCWKEHCTHIGLYLNVMEDQDGWIKQVEYMLSQN